MIARWIGAAPRQRGSSEAWRLKAAEREGFENRLSAGSIRRRRPPRRRRRARAWRPPLRRPATLVGVKTGRPELARLRARPGSAAAPFRGRRAAARGYRPPRPHDRAPTISRSVGTAKSGVPMKTRRSANQASTFLPSSLSLRLCRFAALANFLMTRSRLSLEMWSMNRTPLRWSISCCRQVASRPARLDLARLAVEVEIFDLHLRRPLDLLVIFRDRQAALLVGRLLFRRPGDLRIDEDLRLVLARPSSTSP